MHTRSFVLASALLAAMFALLGGGPVLAQTGSPPAAGTASAVYVPIPTTVPTAPTVVPTQPAISGAGTLAQPTPVPVITTTAAVTLTTIVPVGQAFMQSNKDLFVCRVENASATGGAGDVDLDAIFASINVTRAEIERLYLVPVAGIASFDDLSSALDKSATVDRSDVINLPNLFTVGSGDYHLVLKPVSSPLLWYFGIAAVTNGGVVVKLEEVMPKCDRAEPPAPAEVVKDTDKTTRKPPATGFLDNPWKGTSLPVSLGLLGLVGIGVTIANRRRPSYRTTRRS